MSQASQEPSDNVPLESSSVPAKNSANETKSGLFLSKTRIALVAALIVILIIVIIVLAVLFGIARARLRREEREHEKGTEPSTTMTTSTPILPTTPGTEAWWNPRLPSNIIPRHYNLFLNITVDLPRFDGRVGIDIEVNNITDLIILHNNGLNISAVQVISKSRNVVPSVKNHFTFVKYQYHVVQLESSIHPGNYSIHLTFKAFFSPVLRGMWRGRFMNPDKKKVNYAATQFEATDARRVFPCFDEPALKATFNVSIAHRSDYVALCNMPIYKTETTDGQKIDYYGKTVTMPTYLLAFVVGDFKYVETFSKNKIRLRYYSRPAFLNKTQHALEVGGKIMSFFEDYLGIRYSLSKEDQVAIPDFGPGAMENWGLILYRERLLLWDPKEATEQDKQLIISVITHELAHQWFGNIVTLDWWNEIWLNEGFAKFFEYPGKAVAEPAWKTQDDMISSIMSRSFDFDGQPSSNPIRPPVQNGMQGMAGVTYYDKGACVLRMLQAFLGNDTFLEGLKIYLKRHAFANAVSDDLWRALTEASCKRGQCVNVKQIMDTWILQMGYPVVTLKRVNATHYLVSQSRFLFDDTANVTQTVYKSPFGYSWVIPFTYVTKSQAGHRLSWMNMSSAVIPWDGSGWIKANTNYKGFYLTNYEESNWRALAKQLNENHTVFSPSDRAGLLMDALNLAQGNKLNFSIAIGMTEYMTKETEYVPWNVLLQKANKIKDILSKTSNSYKYLMKYLVFLGKKEYEGLGLKDVGGTIDKYKRSDFVKLFCQAQVKSCIDNATESFKAWMKNPEANAIPPNLRSYFFYYGIAHGGLEEWDFLYSQYNKTQDKGSKRNILFGLAASKEAWIIERYLSYALLSGKFGKEDIRVLIYIAKYNPFGGQLAWSFVRANWERLVRRYKGVATTYMKLVAPVADTFNSPFGLEEVQRFNKEMKINPVQRAVVEGGIKKRIRWLQKNEKDIENALEQLLKKHNQISPSLA